MKRNLKIKKIIEFFNSNEKIGLFFLMGIAFILRVIYCYFTYSQSGTKNWADDWLYLIYGKQIAQGNWMPFTYETPFMMASPFIPLIIALFTLLFSDPVIPFFTYNILACSFVVPVLYYLGKIVFTRNTGWLLAIWGIFNLDFFKYLPHVLKEPTLYLFVPVILLFLIKSIKNNYSSYYLVLSVLSFSFLIHTDERFIIYLPIFPLAFLLAKPFDMKRISKATVLWVGILFLSMLPWGIRNYYVFDQVVILNPRTTTFTSKIWGENLVKLPFLDGYKIDSVKYQEALKFGEVHDINPRKYGKLESRVKAFINFWQPTYFKPTYIQYGFRPQQWSLQHNMAGLLFYGIFLPFYFFGIILLIKEKHMTGLFLASIPIIHSLLHAFMVWPLERYRSPVTFIVVMIGLWVTSKIYKVIINKFYRN